MNQRLTMYLKYNYNNIIIYVKIKFSIPPLVHDHVLSVFTIKEAELSLYIDAIKPAGFAVPPSLDALIVIVLVPCNILMFACTSTLQSNDWPTYSLLK